MLNSVIFQQRRLIELISYIDLTTLAGDDTKQRVSDLVDKAIAPWQGQNNGESIFVVHASDANVRRSKQGVYSCAVVFQH